MIWSNIWSLVEFYVHGMDTFLCLFPAQKSTFCFESHYNLCQGQYYKDDLDFVRNWEYSDKFM